MTDLLEIKLAFAPISDDPERDQIKMDEDEVEEKDEEEGDGDENGEEDDELITKKGIEDEEGAEE